MPRRLLREPHLLAHELRTPLSVLAGWMSLIRDGDISPRSYPDRWQSAMDACQAAVDRLNLVISEACDEATALKRPGPQLSDVLHLLQATQEAIDHSKEVMDRIRLRREGEASSRLVASETRHLSD
jgi:signal transduction histidine kinase